MERATNQLDFLLGSPAEQLANLPTHFKDHWVPTASQFLEGKGIFDGSTPESAVINSGFKLP